VHNNDCDIEKLYRALITGIHKHHIIPKAVYDEYAKQLSNLVGKDAFENLTKLPNRFHGNHPAYSDWIRGKLDEFSGNLDANTIKTILKNAKTEIFYYTTIKSYTLILNTLILVPITLDKYSSPCLKTLISLLPCFLIFIFL